MIDTFEDLARKVEDARTASRAAATLASVKDALNEAGIGAARRNLDNALSGLEVAQAAKREADVAERQAKDELDKTLVAAEWALEPPEAEKKDGKTFVAGREVVSWVAADKAAWKKQQAALDPAVVAAQAKLRACEFDTAVARDAVIVADKRLGACRADLDAAVATLHALSLALPARRGS